MKILALDTSTEYLSLALWLDGEVTAHDQHVGQRHAELALPVLRELLDQAGLALTGFDGIAFGQGPGSFTGLRIGCGIAQGLAFGANLPVVGVGTLLALAASSGHDKVIACIDARMGEVYHAAYVRSGDAWQETHGPGLYAPGAVPPVEGAGWIGAGSGWLAYPEVLPQCYPNQLSEVLPDVLPQARQIAALAAPVFARGEAVIAAEATPLYVRNKVALTMEERGKR